jgi:hypothetical protein
VGAVGDAQINQSVASFVIASKAKQSRFEDWRDG